MSSNNIITASEFALLLRGIQNFFSTKPLPSSHGTTAVASPDESSRSQIPASQQQDYQQQQLQQASPELHRQPVGSYPPKPEFRPSVTVTATECHSGSAYDQQAPKSWVASYVSNKNHVTLSVSPEPFLPSPESAHDNINDSLGTTESSTALSTSTTKEDYHVPALATNATEFIANFVWDLAPARPFTKDSSNQATASVHLPEPESLKGAEATGPSPVSREETLNGYNRHPTHRKSNLYTQAEMMPIPDDGHSAQLILERLRPLQDEPNRTTLTEDENLALIEHGRTIGRRGSWTHQRHQIDSHNNHHNSNHRLQPHQHHQRMHKYPNGPSPPGRSGNYPPYLRSKITYSRDFLMSFSGFNVPPDSIDRIRWIQRNPTLDKSQKVAGSRMPRSQHRIIQEPTMQQPSFQDPSNDHFDQEMHEAESQRRHTTREGVGGGEVSTHCFSMPPHQQNPVLDRPQETAGPRMPRAYRPVFQEPSRDLQGSHRPDLGHRQTIGGGERRGEMTIPGFPMSRPPTPTVPRPNVQRSYASASGSLSGSVYSFKTRDPLGPPAAPRAGLHMRGFQSRTTL